MYRFPWYLTLVSTNHASSNPGQYRTVSLMKEVYADLLLPLGAKTGPFHFISTPLRMMRFSEGVNTRRKVFLRGLLSKMPISEECKYQE